jgi:hypothetical protein
MAPPVKGSSESLMSMKEIDAALLQMIDDSAGPGSRINSEGKAMLHMLDKKTKLELLVMTDTFEEHLKKASPTQVQEMVDNGIFKIVCTQLGGLRGQDMGETSIALGADRLSVFLNILPELSSKAWEFCRSETDHGSGGKEEGSEEPGDSG